jgi:hypothetical protein
MFIVEINESATFRLIAVVLQALWTGLFQPTLYVSLSHVEKWFKFCNNKGTESHLFSE